MASGLQDFLCGGNRQAPQAVRGAPGGSLRGTAAPETSISGAAGRESLAAQCLLLGKSNLQVEEVLATGCQHPQGFTRHRGAGHRQVHSSEKRTLLSGNPQPNQPKSNPDQHASSDCNICLYRSI